MKTTLLYLMLFVTAIAGAQIINIPDANFKAKLLSANTTNDVATNGNQHIVIDTNGNGEIEVYEALQVTGLNVSQSAINSLEGIREFDNIISLNCSLNSLPALDVSGLVSLQTINCFISQITSLNVSGCVGLVYLNCQENYIASLDLSGLISLTDVSCPGNLITSLNLSSCVNLRNLNAPNNLLTTIDVRELPNLIGLWVTNNLLTSVYCKNGSNEFSGTTETWFSGNPNLSYICVDENEMGIIEANAGRFGIPATATITSFCPLADPNQNTIQGALTFDAAGDGCDTTDFGQSFMRVSINDGTENGATFTTPGGGYRFFTGTGTFSVYPEFENAYFTAQPNPASVTFPVLDGSVTTQDFCIIANGIYKDLEVVIAPLGRARPGFDSTYRIVYKNKGNQMLSGNVVLNYDAAILEYLGASVAEDNIQPNSITWNYDGLRPFESRFIEIDFNVNSPLDIPQVNIGDILAFTVVGAVTEDDTPLDNEFRLEQVVVGAFDPNNIICLEGATESADAIGNYLHYIVNFENTGNFSAEDVEVTMAIDPAEFDINSLQLLNSSHEVNARINENTIAFRFSNIMLDAAAHGNILFKLKSRPNLVAGDEVANRASIVFDFNEPVVTNEANTAFNILGSDNFTKDALVKIYPNPAKNTITIEAESSIQSVQMYDVQGRLLQTVMVNSNVQLLNIASRPAGIYFIKITTDKGIKTEKVIKQ